MISALPLSSTMNFYFLKIIIQTIKSQFFDTHTSESTIESSTLNSIMKDTSIDITHIHIDQQDFSIDKSEEMLKNPGSSIKNEETSTSTNDIVQSSKFVGKDEHITSQPFTSESSDIQEISDSSNNYLSTSILKPAAKHELSNDDIEVSNIVSDSIVSESLSIVDEADIRSSMTDNYKQSSISFINIDQFSSIHHDIYEYASLGMSSIMTNGYYYSNSNHGKIQPCAIEM